MKIADLNQRKLEFEAREAQANLNQQKIRLILAI